MLFNIKNKKILLIIFLFSVFSFSGFSYVKADFILNSPATSCPSQQGEAELRWNDQGAGYSYVAQRRIAGGGGFTDLFITSTTSLSYIDRTALSDVSYEYQIRSLPTSSNSNIVFIPAMYCATVLNQPTGSCMAYQPRINLQWVASLGSINKYEIYRRQNAGAYLFVASTTPAILNYNDGPQIVGGDSYDYYIKTFWTSGASRNSNPPKNIEGPSCSPNVTISTSCEVLSPGGPSTNLSWSNLYGVQYYNIYRRGPSDPDHWIASTTLTSYKDLLVESFPLGYQQSGTLYYRVQPIWPNGSAITEKSIAIPQCPPFLKIEKNCDDFKMLLSWAKTQGANQYNVFKATNTQPFDPNPYFQTTLNQLEDYLGANPECSDNDCTFTYKIVAQGPGFNKDSNTVTKTINCTPQDPSPAPVLDEPSAYCSSSDSQISLAWLESNYTKYYILYRNTFTTSTFKYPFAIDNDVLPNVDYTYWVKSIGQAGKSTTSVNQKTIKALDCTPPSVPTVSYSRGCYHTKAYVDLSWISTLNTLNYDIYRGSSSNPLEIIAHLPGDQYIYRDDTVNFSSPYYYKVAAIGPEGTIMASSTLSNLVTYNCLPQNPNLALSKNCNGALSIINLSWASDTINVHHYDIYRDKIIRATVDDPASSTYSDSAGDGVNYSYFIDSVGWDGRKSSSSATTTSYSCNPPGQFNMQEPLYPIVCSDAYPSTTISWDNSNKANYYNLNLYRYTAGTETIIGTTTYLEAARPFVNKGLGYDLKLNKASTQRVLIPYNENFYFPIDQDFALSFWIKFYSYPIDNYRDIIGYYDSSVSGNWYIGMMNPSGVENRFNSVRFRFYDINNSPSWGRVECNSNWTPDLGKWYNIIFNADRSQDGVLYANGAEICRISILGIDPGPSKPFKINNITDGDYHDISIDQVKIYDRVLTPQEIQQHALLTYDDSNYNNLRLFLRFDEGVGTTVSDSSNHRIDGMVYNNGQWEINGPQCQEKQRWQAIAYNNSPQGTYTDNKVPSSSVQAVLPVCPPAKPGLSLSYVCQGLNSGVKLNWSYSINATSYQIFQDGVLQASTSNSNPGNANSRIYNKMGLTPWQNYDFFVRATGSGLFTNSDILPFIAVDCALPSKPSNVTASYSCFANKPRVTVSWGGVYNTEYYKVFRATGTSPIYMQVATSVATSTTNAYPSVRVNTSYTYYVIAHSPGGDSSSSATTSVFVDYCPVSSADEVFLFTDCTYTDPSFATTQISWHDLTSFNTKEYRIYRNVINQTSTAQLLETIPTTSAKFSRRASGDSTGISNQRYYYWIRTIGFGVGSNYDVYSSPAQITTYKCNVTPSSPSLSDVQLQCKNGKPNNLILWQPGGASATDTVSYKIERDSSASYYFTRQSPFFEKYKESYALKFNDLTYPVGYFIVPTNKSFMVERTPFTIEAWIYPERPNNGTNTYMSIIGRLNGDSAYNALDVQTSTVATGSITSQFYYLKERSSDGVLEKTSYPVNFNKISVYYNQWNLVVFTWNGYAQTAYSRSASGQYQQSSIITDTIYSVSTGTNGGMYYSLRIGRGPSDVAYDDRFNGKIDDLRIYGRALSPAEISDHYSGQYKNELNLKAVWHFDESGLGEKTPDSSGYDHHGTILGATLVDPGRIGKAFDFDSSKYNYIDLDKGGDIGLDSFSWEFWMKTSYTSPPGEHQAMFNKVSQAIGGGGKDGWVGVIEVIKSGGVNSGQTLFYVTDGDYNNAYRYSSISVADGNWHHIVGVCNRAIAGKHPDIYIDGQIRNGDTGGGHCIDLPNLPSGGDLTLGEYFGGSNFDGVIDEVRIYGSALSSTTIQEHYNGIFNNDSGLGLRGLWHLDEGESVSWNVYDSSGNGNDGSYYLSTGMLAPAPNDIWFEVPAGSPTYVAPLANNVTYEYKIKALGIGKESGYSNTMNITTTCGPKINSFVVATTCGAGGSIAQLSWQAVNSNYVDITKFWDPDGESQIINHGPAIGNLDDLNLEGDKDYTYFIKAYGMGGEEDTKTVTIRSKNCTEAPPIPVIQSVTASCVGIGNTPVMDIEWATDCDKTLSYEIYGTASASGPPASWPSVPNSVFPVPDDCEDGKTREILDNSLKGQDYWYKVKAIGGQGSSQSNPAFQVVPDCESMPPNAVNLNYDSIISTGNLISLNLKWNDAGNETEYRVYRCESGCSDLTNYELVKTLTADVLNWQDVNPTPPSGPNEIIDDRIYYYMVQSINNNCIPGVLGDCKKSNQPGPDIPIAIPGTFNIIGGDLGNKIVINLLTNEEPATTAAAGRAYYTFYRGSENNESSGTWETFTSGCVSTTTLSCIDSNPDRNKRFYMVRAICENWEQTPINYSQSDILDLFIFAPKWKERSN
jgi:hypothetical protein